jgi:hypothetical protein
VFRLQSRESIFACFLVGFEADERGADGFVRPGGECGEDQAGFVGGDGKAVWEFIKLPSCNSGTWVAQWDLF